VHRPAALRHDRPRLTRTGFSLIELAGALVVVALLVVLVLPRFRAYERRVHRAVVVQALRDVAARENAYWRAVGTYTADTNALMAPRSSGITVRIVRADSLGWSARATHRGDAVVCAIAYGAAPMLRPATRHNVIGCGA